MINKVSNDIRRAMAHVRDGSTVLVSGFGCAGTPETLLQALVEHGAKNLTVVCNNAGNEGHGVAALMRERQVRKLICSYPRGSVAFERLYRAAEIELELVPQGTLTERLRAAGAGIGAFYCPTSAGTLLAASKEVRDIGGIAHLLEYPLYGDVALVQAAQADRWGNLVYRKSARNFGPVMAAAAQYTIASVQQVVGLGELDPEAIATPGIYVDCVLALSAIADSGSA